MQSPQIASKSVDAATGEDERTNTPMFVAQFLRYGIQYDDLLAAQKDFGNKRVYYVHEMDETPQEVKELSDLMNGGAPDRYISMPQAGDMMTLPCLKSLSDQAKESAFAKYFVFDSELETTSVAALFDGLVYASVMDKAYSAEDSIRILLNQFEAQTRTDLDLIDATRKMLAHAQEA